eukprot:18263-Alexandrium_andersonii.AAC.1
MQIYSARNRTLQVVSAFRCILALSGGARKRLKAAKSASRRRKAGNAIWGRTDLHTAALGVRPCGCLAIPDLCGR